MELSFAGNPIGFDRNTGLPCGHRSEIYVTFVFELSGVLEHAGKIAICLFFPTKQQDMKAEIITIGDEILIGQIVDTNSAWIAERLNEAGIRVMSRISVGDDAGAIKDALADAFNSADVVIMTGGLGPTKDDITKVTLADFFGCPMVENREVGEMNRHMLSLRGIEYNALNQSQAMLPACCTPLPNPLGTAPGMWFERDGKVLVALPGVPFEMKHLLAEEVLVRLRVHYKLGDVTHRTMLTFGIAESILAERIAPWEDALPHWLRLAYLPNPSGIRLRLSAYDVDGATAQREIDEQFARLKEIISEYVVGYGETSVQAEVAEILRSGGRTLAVAESCTGGSIAARFTAMAGASDYFRCGVVAYAADVKAAVLGVDPAVIESRGVVSREVAEQMAEGARRVGGADYAIATTGVAGPAGGTDENPVGTVWIAVAHPEGVVSRRVSFGGQREQIIDRASAAAINMLRLHLTRG